MRPLFYLLAIILFTFGWTLGFVSWRVLTTPPPPVDPSSRASGENADGVHIQFEDVATAAGIDFLHVDGQTPMHYVPEIMGGGAAWIDYDQDGWIDLFLVQGGKFPPDPKLLPGGPTSRLYRNQGDGTFRDVTAEVGILHPGYGQGVAVGDYDNDGFPDLFLTCYGHCHLFHNEPNGKGSRRFRDVTRAAGVELDGWCTSCGFGDIHGKGYLDLFVCRYVVMDLQNYPFCGDANRNPPLRYSCGPKEFPGSPSVLFRNNGNGTFTNVSKEAGIEADGKGLGVILLDLDGDGKTDIFVGNDEAPNNQYRNLGGGKLESCGVINGTAANWQGKPMGSMGLEADDLTGDGHPELFVTTYYHEGTTLFRNNGQHFTDVSQSAGMFAASWNKVGWGTAFLDVDRDGDLDIFVANGHVYRNAAEIQAKSEDGEPYTYGQLPQLFRGDGKGMFKDISRMAGPYFQQLVVGRGVALGDYDNDGASDLVINHVGGPPALLRNETKTPHHWIRLRLEGSRHRDPAGSNRDAIGARVEVRIGERTLVRHIKGGGSYYSAHDRRLLIGLGPAERVDEIEVRWPNAAASRQRFGPLDGDRAYRLIEGTADAVAEPVPSKPTSVPRDNIAP